MLLNVFEPVIVNAPAPPWLSVQLNVDPPPTNVLVDAEVIEIKPVPVPAVVVKLVNEALLNAVVPEPEQTNVPPLNVKFFVPAAVKSLVVFVRVNPAKLSVPLVSVVIWVCPASASVVVIPAPFIVKLPVALPVCVKVPSPTIVKVADEYVPPEAKVKP